MLKNATRRSKATESLLLLTQIAQSERLLILQQANYLCLKN